MNRYFHDRGAYLWGLEDLTFTPSAAHKHRKGCDLCGDGAVDSGLCPVCEELSEEYEDELAPDANCDGYEEA